MTEHDSPGAGTTVTQTGRGSGVGNLPAVWT